MRSSESLSNISPALVKAINAIEGVKKGADNPFFKSKYANLESVIAAAHDALEANGLAVMQGPGPMDGNCITLTTRLIHESGEWVETDFSLPAGKMDPQAAGSAITYARRYSLMAMLNMPAVDDDGEAAMPRTAPQKTAGKQEDTHGPDWPGLTNPSSITSNAAKKDEALVKASIDVKSRLDFAPTVRDLEGLIADVTPTVAKFPETWRRVLWGEYSATLAELKAAE
jgi:hypothetical protein